MIRPLARGAGRTSLYVININEISLCHSSVSKMLCRFIIRYSAVEATQVPTVKGSCSVSPPPHTHVYVLCQLCLLSCANSGLRPESRALSSLSLRFALLINPFRTLIGFDSVLTFFFFYPLPFKCET